ncbi:MAG: hypothetical protein R6U26_04325 [Candidatus Undinarchaeales archaeon]
MQKRGDKPNFKKILLIGSILVLITFTFLMLEFGGVLTGKSILELDANYSENSIKGELTLSPEEEIPQSAKLVFENNGEIISERSVKEFLYPGVYFDILISTEGEESSEEGGEAEEENEEEQVGEKHSEEEGETKEGIEESGGEEGLSEEETEQEEDEETEENEGESEEENEENNDEKERKNPMTGSVISEETKIVQGKVSKGENFLYTLKNNEEFSGIDKRSIRTESESLDDNVVDFSIDEKDITFSTEYSKDEVTIDLSMFGLSPQPGTLRISIFDNEEEIFYLIVNASTMEIIGKKENKSKGLMERNIELTQEEENIIRSKFGEKQIKLESATEEGDFLVLKYSLGSYTAEFSYEKGLKEKTLEKFAKKDRKKWIKDIARNLLSKKQIKNRVSNFNDNYPVLSPKQQSNSTE